MSSVSEAELRARSLGGERTLPPKCFCYSDMQLRGLTVASPEFGMADGEQGHFELEG